MGLVKNILYSISHPSMISLVKNQTIFPYYHIVRNNTVDYIKHLYPYKGVEQFEKDLEFLLKHYKPLDPKVLLESKGNLEIPKNHFLLTFDDGLSEVYDIIAPILKKKGVSGVFLVNPNFVDNQDSLYKHDISLIVEALKAQSFNNEVLNEVKSLVHLDTTVSQEELIQIILKVKHSERDILSKITDLLNIDISKFLSEQKPYMTKANIQEMLDDGFYFGGHTMSHPRLPELSLEDQTNQVIDSIQWMKDHFAIDYSLFAFPFWDQGASKELIRRIFEYDKNAVVFGNSGIKKDIHPRIVQRFSLEDPYKRTEKRIVTENFYKLFNQVTGGYKIKRT